MNDIKLLIKEQFPEFYQEEFPNFILFLEKYYSYLELANSVPYTYDTDTSVDVFLDQLRNQFAKNVPQFGKLSDRDFLVFAKEFYTSRGSSDSYRFLIRAMFGKELDIEYPSNFILRASDGRWNQTVSIQVQTTEPFDGATLSDFKIILATGQTITLRSERVIQRPGTPNLYEIYLAQYSNQNISVGDAFSFIGATGTVVSHVVSCSVVSSATGFKIGEYFETGGADPIRFKISTITDGLIKKVDVLQSGSIELESLFVSVKSGTHLITNSSTTSFTPPAGESLLKLNVGSVTKYPGYYSSPNGFLSDTIKLQNDFYQPFSYILKLDEQLSLYKDVVLKLLHPAGFALWAEYSLTNDFSLDSTLDVLAQLIRLLVQDEVVSIDNYAFLLKRPFFDTTSPTDFVALKPTKNIVGDSINTSDSGNLAVLTEQNYASQDYFLTTGSQQYVAGPPASNRTW